MSKINRFKVELVEKEKSGKWLLDKLGKSSFTVSKWHSNTIQPDKKTPNRFASLLNVEIRNSFNLSEQ